MRAQVRWIFRFVSGDRSHHQVEAIYRVLGCNLSTSRELILCAECSEIIVNIMDTENFHTPIISYHGILFIYTPKINMFIQSKKNQIEGAHGKIIYDPKFRQSILKFYGLDSQRTQDHSWQIKSLSMVTDVIIYEGGNEKV